MKHVYFVILLALLGGGLFLASSVARADCSPASPGSDNVVCDNNPAAPADDVEANAGNDNITVDAGTTVTDTDNDGNDDAIEGGPGNDTIINNGTLIGDMVGDGDTHGGTGADSLVNNGSIAECNANLPECTPGDAEGEIEGGPGNDTIINNGTVDEDIEGDDGNDSLINSGSIGSDIDGGLGNDTITNTATGTIGENLTGDDDFGNGGNDIITNYGTVLGWIEGDAGPGDGGNDFIYNYGSVFEGIEGDYVDGNGGHDLIINYGTVYYIDGDNVFFGDGGNDFIINYGSVETDIFGDEAGGQGGNDFIINYGTVDGYITGDAACTGGNDYIINNGVAGTIEGDGVCGGSGNDTIKHNGTVGDIYADEDGLVQGEGNDRVFIRFGAVVTGVVRGGENIAGGNNDFDVISFTDLSQAVADAIAVACPDPDTGCIFTVNGVTYDVAEFEQLLLLLAALEQDLESAGIDVRHPEIICDDGAVKVVRDELNNQWVFSGFNLLPDDGFLVAMLPSDQLFPTNVFSNPGAPAEGQGWTVVLDNTLHTRVFDASGNLISDRCLYRDEPNDPLVTQYGGQPSGDQ